MEYTIYSTEDFLADESFQSFVVGNDPMTVQFWCNWIAQHPAKEAEFNEAVGLLQLLATRMPQPLPRGLKQAETAKLWQTINPSVDDAS